MWRWILGGVLVLVAMALSAVAWMLAAEEDQWLAGEVAKGRAVHTTLDIRAQGRPFDAVLISTPAGQGLITDVEAARDVPFTYYRPGFWRRLFGDVGCANDARVFFELIHEGERPITMKLTRDDLATCAVAQTDITALWGLSQLAENATEAGLTQAAWLAFDKSVRADPALVGMRGREFTRAAYDYRCSIDLPFVWQSDDAAAAPLLPEIHDRTDAILGPKGDAEGWYRFDLHDLSRDAGKVAADERNARRAEGEALETSSAVVRRGGKIARINGLAIYHPEISLGGSKEDCAAFDRFDFTQVLDGLRDNAVLARAWDARQQVPETDLALDWDTLLAAEMQRGETQQMLYDYHYIRPKQ